MKLGYRSLVKGLFGSMLGALACVSSVILPQHASASGTYPTDTFDIPEGAYKATFVTDLNQITVMSFSGNFDKQLEGGQFNRAARAEVAREFFRTHPDNYDFLVTFTAFEYETGDAVAFYHGVRNDVQGIGLPLFDNSALYNSQGKLQGMVDMAAMSRYKLDSFNPEFDYPLSVLAHEVLHRFGSFVRFDDGSGTPSTALLGKDASHWSFFLDSDASVQYGSEWRANGDGTFTAVGARQFYSPLDLYLMGFKSASEVPDFTLLDSDTTAFHSHSLPQKGAKINGTPITVGIDDIIAVEGPRIPDAAQAQKEFRFAFILLVGENDDFSKADVAKIDMLRKSFIDRFSIMTGGRGIAHVYPEALPAAELGQQTGVVPDQGDSIRVQPADVADALSWLKSKQDSVTGRWQDTANTQVRDTSVVLSVLQEMDSSFTSGGVAADWLENQVPANTDSLARILLAAGSGANSSLTALVSRQGADGGWGLLPNYKSNPLDTALALRALAELNGSAAAITKTVDYLTASRTTDRAWAESAEGTSSLLSTALVVQSLVTAGQGDSQLTRDAVLWLASQQNADGGFGHPSSSIHETAEVVIAAVKAQLNDQLDVPAALNFISDRQRESGSWEGSVYSTAVAARALRSVSLPNLAVQSFTAAEMAKRDGERVNLAVTVVNDSPLNTEATQLQLFDGDPQQGGTAIGVARAVPLLNPGARVSFNIVWDTFNQSGPNTLYAVVNHSSSFTERSRADNTRTLTYEVAPAPQLADLEVSLSEMLVTPEAPATLPAALGVSAIVRNLGLTSAEAVTVELWQTVAGSEQLVDSTQINLATRSSTTVNFLAELTQSGETRFRVVVDPANQVQEAREDNNAVVRLLSTQPSLDLEILPADIFATPSPALLYQDTTIAVTVRNRGTLPSPSFEVVVLAGEDGSFTTLQTTSMTLEAGEAKTLDLVWRANKVGETTIVVHVDEDNLLAEADEDNNSASAVIATQQLSGTNLTLNFADLAIAPSPAKEGLGASITTVVYNSGTESAISVPVAFYEGDPTSGGTQIGQIIIIPEIAAGFSINLSHVWPLVSGDHRRFIFAVIDPENTIAEYNEDDNQVFREITVDRLADLAISSSNIQLEPAFPNLGDTAQVRVLVNNLGKQAAANVLVRVYDGDPAAGGMEIGNGYVIDSINGNASGQIQFSYAFLNEGTQELFAQVDPDGEVAENNIANNSAKKLIAIQDGTFFVNERYISPDGNGTKDTTSYFFRLDAPETVGVEVLDRSGRIVKTFTEKFTNVASGSVLWDGRSDAGALVNDGEYFFTLKNAAGQRIGNTRVTVDTNRSGLVQALGTRFEHRVNYQCLFNSENTVFSKDGQFIYFSTTGPNSSMPTALSPGLYRANTDGTDPVLINDLGPDFIYQSWRFQFAVSDDNSRLVTFQRENGSNFVIRDFRIGIDSERRFVAELPDYTTEFAFIPGTHKLVIKQRIYVTDGYSSKVFVMNLEDSQPETEELLTVNPLPSPDFYRPIEQLVDFVVSDSGSGFGIYVHQEGNALVPGLLGFVRKFYILEPETYALIPIGVRPSAFDWSPTGDRLLVGDAADGGVSIYDKHGEKLQHFSFDKQYSLPDGYEYITNVLPPEFRTERALIGKVDSVTWSPDGLEFAFFFEDYSKGFLHYRVIQATGVVAGGYGEYFNYPSDLSVEIFNHKTHHGIYTVSAGDGRQTKVAEVIPQEYFANYYHRYATDLIPLEELDKNQYGIHVTEAGLPYLDLYLSGNGYLNYTPAGNWYFGDSKYDRLMHWLPGSNALLLNVRNDSTGDSSYPEGISTAFIVGLEPSVPSREIFITDDDVSYTGFAVPSSSGQDLLIKSRDRFDTCPNDYPVFNKKRVASLLNLTADVRAVRSSSESGIRLRGSAVDLNLESVQLEFARTTAPDIWQPISPASQEQMIDGEFTTWVPPAPGAYLVRLTVKDLAGNVRQDITRTSVALGSSISGLYRSPAAFSPNGDGVLDTTQIHFTPMEPVLLQASIMDDEGRIVRTIQHSFTDIGIERSISWDGRDQSGNLLPDGVYTFQLQNFKYFVTLDKQFPQVTSQTARWHSRSGWKDTLPLLGLQNEYSVVNIADLGFSVSDNIGIPDARLEFRAHGSSAWVDTERSVQEQGGKKVYYGPAEIADWRSGQFRIWARDSAGNTTTYILSSALKLNQASIFEVAINKNSVDDSTKKFVLTNSKVSFDEPLQFNSPGMLLLDGNAQLVFQIANTMSAPLASVEIVYADQKQMNSQTSVPVSHFGRVAPCDPASDTRSDVCFHPAVDSQSVAELPSEFAANWDINSIELDPSTSYRVYVRLTDTEGRVANSNSVAFRGGFSATLAVRPESTRMAVIAMPAKAQDFLSVQLFVQSNDDIRFLQTTEFSKLIDSTLKPISVGNGQAIEFDISELLPCSNYNLSAKLKFKDGRTYTINPISHNIPCLKIEWDVRPLFNQECNTVPSQRVEAGVKIEALQVVRDSTELKELLVYWTSSDGLQNVLFNKNNPGYDEQKFEIDVSELPAGNLPLTIELIDTNDNKILRAATLPVVHTPPTIDVINPLEGGKYCASQYVKVFTNEKGELVEKSVKGIEIQGTMQSAVTLTYTVSGNAGSYCDSVNYDSILKPRLFPPESEKFCKPVSYRDKEGQNVSFASVVNNLVTNISKAKGSLGIAEFEGADTASLQVVEYNWSGVKTCRTVTVDVDAEVSGLEVVLNSNESVVSREEVPTYSPNGDGIFDDIRWHYSIEENVSVTINISSVNWLGRSKSGKNIFSDPVFLESVVDRLSVSSGSDHEFQWQNADSASDGFYQADVVTVDGCGIEERHQFYIKIDNTPPQIHLTSPSSGQPLGIIVETIGSVTDAHRYHVDLKYGKPGDALAPISRRLYNINIANQVLGQWNTFGLIGDWVLEVSATDALGNTNSYTQPVLLPERIELISSLKADELFSPNSDGVLDVVRVEAMLEGDVRADVDVMRDGQILDSLFANQVFSAGPLSFIWDGLNTENLPFQDGPYQIRVRAVSLTGGGTIHEEFVSFGLDNTLPNVNVQGVTGGVLGIGALDQPVVIAGTIEEVNFGSYDVTLVTGPSGPLNLSIQGDDKSPVYGLASLTKEWLTEQGIYQVKIYATDLAGNAKQSEITLLYDTVPPIVQISSPLAGVVKKRADNLVVGGNIVEKHLLSYKATIASVSENIAPVVQEFTAIPQSGDPLATFSLATLPEGQYIVTVEATDKAGHSASSKLNFNVDDSQPVAQILQPQTDAFVSSAQSINVVAKDIHIKEYALGLYSLNGNTPTFVADLAKGHANIDGQSVFVWKTLPADGEYLLALTVKDQVENKAVTEIRITVDTQAPDPVNIEQLDLNAATKAISLVWSASSSQDAIGYHVYRSGNRLTTVPITDRSYVDLGVTDGKFEYAVTAVDRAGLESTKTKRSIVADFTPPSVSIRSPASGTAVSGVVSIMGTAFSSENFHSFSVFAGPDGDSLAEVGGATLPVQNGLLAQLDTSNLANGQSYQIRLRASDVFGNTAEVTTSIVVDNQEPAAPVGLRVTFSGRDATVNWTAVPEGDIAGYLLYSNNELVTASGPVVGDLSPYLLASANYIHRTLPDGEYTYYVLAMDKAGNISPPSEPITATLDLRAPKATFKGLYSGYRFEENLLLSAEVVDQDVARVEFSFRPSGTTQWQLIYSDLAQPFEFIWDVSGLAYGSYQVRAVATDKRNNVDTNPAIYNLVKADLTPPAPVQITSVTVDGGSIELVWELSEEATFYYVAWEGANHSGSYISTELTYSDTQEREGIYKYSINAVDAAGNISVPSNIVEVIVFSPKLDLPPTPTTAPMHEVVVTTLPNTQVNLAAAGTVISSTRSNADGVAQLAYSLKSGLNNLELYAVTDEGFISKKVIMSQALTSVPSKVEGVSVAETADANVAVTWSPNTETDLSGYKIYLNGSVAEELIEQPPITFESTDYLDGVENLTDGDSSTAWFGNYYGSWTLDIVLATPMLVTELLLEWSQDEAGSPDEFELLAFQAGRFVKVASVQNAGPVVTQDVLLSTPYLTDRLRLKTSELSSWAYGARLSEISMRVAALRNHVDFFSHTPNPGELIYQVSAVSQFGLEGPLSDPAVYDYGGLELPQTISDLNAAVSDNDVSLTWSDSSTEVALYRIYRNGIAIGEVPIGQLMTYADLDLTNGTYIYTVASIDVAGDAIGASNEAAANIALAVLPAPVDISAVLEGTNNRVRINWVPAPDSTPESFRVYRRELPQSQFVPVEQTSALTLLDSAPQLGKTYEYYVVAIDGDGNESAPSPVARIAVVDTVSPVRPMIIFPASEGSSISTQQSKSAITGYAEPGSIVMLNHNGAIGLEQQVPTSETIQSSGGGTDFIMSEAGQVALLGYGSLSLLNKTSYQSKSVPNVRPDHILWVGEELMLIDRSVSNIVIWDPLSGAVRAVDNRTNINFNQIERLLRYDAALDVLHFVYRIDGRLLYQWTTLSTGETQSVELPSGFYDFQRLSASTDGRYYALAMREFYDAIEIRLIDTVAGSTEVISVPGGYGYSAPKIPVAWSKQGHKFLFSRLNEYERYELVEYDLDAGETTLVVQHPARSLYTAYYSSDGKIRVIGRDDENNTELLSYDRETSEFTSVYEFGDSLHHQIVELPNGLWLDRGPSPMRVHSPAGLFYFSDVKLTVGNNKFEVTSRDLSGNESDPSGILTINRVAPNLADLSVNVEIFPFFPAVNQEVQATVKVRNLGTASSGSTQLVIVVKDSNGEPVTQQSAINVSDLAAGEIREIPFKFTVADEGRYELIARIDPTNIVSESNEDNNQVAKPVDVLAEARPFLRVTLITNAAGGTSFGAHQVISGTATLVNAGGPFSGIIKVRVVDGAGFPVEELGELTVQNVANGATINHLYNWNTKNYFAGNYQILASLYDGNDSIVAQTYSPLVIVEDLQFISSVRLSSPTFGANSKVQITGVIANTGGNAIFEGAEANIVIANVAGDVVYSTSIPVGQILPGASARISHEWNSANYQPGNYVVRMVVLPQNANVASQSSLANFNIIPGAPQLTGNFVAEGLIAGKGETIGLDFSLKNSGNSSLTAVAVTLELVNLKTNTHVAQVTQDVALGYMGTEHLAWAVSPGNVALGQYQALLKSSVTVQGTVYNATLDKVSVQIVDSTAPTVELLEPTSGSLFNSVRKLALVRASDMDSGVASAAISIDQGTFVKMSAALDRGAGSYLSDLSALSDGPHSIRLVATDKAANTSTPIEISVVVDNTAPLVQYSGVASGQLYNVAVTPTVAVNDTNLASVELTLNGNTFTSGQTITADGDYRLTVIATDQAGNVTSDVALFGIDTIAALITIDGVNDGGRYSSVVTPIIDVVDSNLNNVVITLNDEPYVSGTPISLEGSYLLRVSASDAAGNVSERTVEFVVDQAGPEAPVITSPANNASVSTNVISILGTAEPGTLLILQNSTTGESYSVTVEATGEFALGGVSLVAGANQLFATVQDNAGNVSEPASLVVTFAQSAEVEVENGVSARANVLIWATGKNTNYHPQCSNGQHSNHSHSYPHYEVDLEATIELIQQAYDGAGIGYSLVRSPEAFRQALRTQKYNVVNLINLKDAHALPTHFEGEQGMELRAAVLSGTGLILNFTRAYSFYILRDMMKADVAGETTNNIIDLNGGVFGDNSAPWVLDQTGLKVVMEGANGFGNMNYKYYGCSQPTCNQPAVVTNRYGLGDTVLVPFNLPDAGNTAEVKDFIVNLAKYAVPDNLVVQPETRYALDWKLTGLDGITNLVINQGIPAGFNYSAVSSGGSINGAGAQWVFNNLATDDLWFSALVKTSSGPTSSSIFTEGYDTVVSGGTHIFDDTLDMTVTRSLAQMQSNLLSMVNSLPTNSSNAWRKNNALQRINQAFGLARATKNDSNLAILYMLLAIDDLRAIGNSEPVLILASQIVRAYQSRWADQP